MVFLSCFRPSMPYYTIDQFEPVSPSTFVFGKTPQLPDRKNSTPQIVNEQHSLDSTTVDNLIKEQGFYCKFSL